MAWAVVPGGRRPHRRTCLLVGVTRSWVVLVFSGSFTREAIATRRTGSRMWETAIVVFRAFRGSFWVVREGLTLCHVHARVQHIQSYRSGGLTAQHRLHKTQSNAGGDAATGCGRHGGRARARSAVAAASASASASAAALRMHRHRLHAACWMMRLLADAQHALMLARCMLGAANTMLTMITTLLCK